MPDGRLVNLLTGFFPASGSGSEHGTPCVGRSGHTWCSVFFACGTQAIRLSAEGAHAIECEIGMVYHTRTSILLVSGHFGIFPKISRSEKIKILNFRADRGGDLREWKFHFSKIEKCRCFKIEGVPTYAT